MIPNFRCHKCGETELGFERLATARADVAVQEDCEHVEYGEFHIVDDISQSPDYNYICRDCGWRLHAGHQEIQTESDLFYYLSLPFAEIAAMNEEYLACLAEQEEAYDAVDEAALHDVM